MKQRGKKSSASLSVVTPQVQQRPAAPDDLLPDERALWDKITGSRAADFFDVATLPLLSEYCRLKTSIDLIAEQIEDFDPDWFATNEGIKRYKTLSEIRDKSQGRMIALARSMRLTQQARYVPDKVKNKPKGTAGTQRLWQRD